MFDWGKGAINFLCSCRDDMESLEYIILYFLRPLPWQGLKAANQKQKEELILKKKKTTSIKDLCDGLSQEFAIYFDHIHSLDFDDQPKYSYLRKIFRDLYIREGFGFDYIFDWAILKYFMAIQ
jgi:hypothetical protein